MDKNNNFKKTLNKILVLLLSNKYKKCLEVINLAHVTQFQFANISSDQRYIHLKQECR